MKRIQFALALVALISTQLFSQKTAEWKGGFPGREADWDCPQNWSGGSVPNEFSDVAIPDISTGSRALPVIKKGLVQINSLSIDAPSVLLVAEGAELLVFGQYRAASPASVRGAGKFRVLNEQVTGRGVVAKN